MAELQTEKNQKNENEAAEKKAKKSVTYMPGPVHEAVLEQLGHAQTNVTSEGELASPADYTPPEELYQNLINIIKQYHPSDNLELWRRLTKWLMMPIRIRKENLGNPTLYIPYVWPSSWLSWSLIRKPLPQDFCMTS